MGSMVLRDLKKILDYNIPEEILTSAGWDKLVTKGRFLETPMHEHTLSSWHKLLLVSINLLLGIHLKILCSTKVEANRRYSNLKQ